MHTSDADLLQIETSTTQGLYNVLADVATRLHARQLIGAAIIIADQPQESCTILQRLWDRMLQQLVAQYADDTDGRGDLTAEITAMQDYRITAALPYQRPQSDVFILSPQDIGEMFPVCKSLFIIANLKPDAYQRALSYVPPDALVVRYIS